MKNLAELFFNNISANFDTIRIFSGLDINTCSLHMLQKIAGLTKARAQAILDTRNSVGFFHNREQVFFLQSVAFLL
jgi:transcriptional accessory protein Tex/SPT6